MACFFLSVIIICDGVNLDCTNRNGENHREVELKVEDERSESGSMIFLSWKKDCRMPSQEV